MNGKTWHEKQRKPFTFISPYLSCVFPVLQPHTNVIKKQKIWQEEKSNTEKIWEFIDIAYKTIFRKQNLTDNLNISIKKMHVFPLSHFISTLIGLEYILSTNF